GDGLVLHHADGKTTRARRAIVAIGRSGNHRRLGVPGEDLDKVFNRLYDPKDYAGQRVLVVGGGDSALETACALAESGASVALSYPGEAFHRPKRENVERLAANPSVRVLLGTNVQRIEPDRVLLAGASGQPTALPNDVVFTMLGRDAPLPFFRRSGIPIRGEWTAARVAGLALFLLFCVFLFNWKSNGAINRYFKDH